MEGLLIALSIAIVLAIPITLVLLLVWVRRLSKRVANLEVEAQQRQEYFASAEPPLFVSATARNAPVKEVTKELAKKPMVSPWDKGIFSGPPDQPAPKDAPETQVVYTLEEPLEPKAEPVPRAVVMRAEKAAALAGWLKVNWIYVVSAASLALAGVFLVQYGIENGYLSPTARVLAALGLGAALVATGEYMRRRWGDGEASPVAYLPSTFSSAGIVTLFSAVLAALHFYALIGPVAALIGLVAVALLAIALGWFSGPLLAAVGITGAMIAPFLVGGESNTPEMFYGYFALLALVGLLVDAIRRWAWVSVLTLMLAYGCALFLYLQVGMPEYMMGLSALLAVAAIAIPPLSLRPGHGGAAIADCFAKGLPRGWPEFPTRLAAVSMLASVAILSLLSLEDGGSFWLAMALLTALFAAIAIWAQRAEALEDLAILPALGILALPVLQAMEYGGVYAQFQDFIEAEPGTPMPRLTFYLVGLATLISLVAAWRSLSTARWPVAWALGAALSAPMMMVGLEMTWMPSDIIGAYPWALSALAIAGVMTALAGRFASVDGDQRMRVALMVLAALSMVAFALIVILSQTALTLALAATLLAAAALDRRFDLKPLMWFVMLGVVVLGWRLVIDPGVPWADTASYPHLIAAYGGTILILIATIAILRNRDRQGAIITVESAIWSAAALFISLLVYRMLNDIGSQGRFDTHWGISLTALVWLISAANQLWRTQIKGPMRLVRWALAAIFAVLGGGLTLIGVVFFNPFNNWGEPVLGPPVIDTLLVAYLLPALLLAFVAWKFGFLSRRWRVVFAGLAAIFAAVYVGLEIRHIWRGSDLTVIGTTQPELYSYTIAMLAVGAGLLYQAVASGSVLLRRIAMSVIALTVAKVFLVDISGLQGLTRVFSFLALGLALAGLAWLNRWAASKSAAVTDEADAADARDEAPDEGSDENPPDEGDETPGD